jgi:hemoglobin-like flavoprotein
MFLVAQALLLFIQDWRGLMTRDEITRVQASWRAVGSVKRVAAELFYVKLFELDSTLKLLLADRQTREQKFLQIVDATVNGLEHSEVMMSAVRELGIRHPLFGDSDEHHGPVATALFWSLEKCLRRDFTDEVRAAWRNVYEVLSKTLRSVTWAEAHAA